MFSLIISIIAIALVAALALASIYYGGDAFKTGTTKAEASTIINQGQQIQAAIAMSEIDEKGYFNDPTETDLSPLVAGEYLKEIPQIRNNGGWVKVSGADRIEMPVNNGDICMEIEKQFDGSMAPPPSTGSLTQAFGCHIDPAVPENPTFTAYFNL